MLKYLPLVILFISCSSTKPTWVDNLDQDPKYFLGLAMIPIHQNGYRQEAFTSAEKEISRQLSVEIKSSSSMKKVVDISRTIQDRYTDITESNIRQTLKNVQKIDEYKDKQNFYLLLGLDKQKYLERKIAQKNQAKDEIKQIVLNLKKLEIVDQLLTLNKAMALILEHDLLYEKDDGDEFFYTKIKTLINRLISGLNMEFGTENFKYNPLLENQISVPISIINNGVPSSRLPISIFLDEKFIGYSISNKDSITEIIISPKSDKDQTLVVNLSDKIFGDENSNFIDSKMRLGSFIIRPVISKLNITVSGPLSKNQKDRITNRFEQFLLSQFRIDDSLPEETKINIIIERNDKPQYADGYPFISYSMGSINIASGIKKNVFKINKHKGSDFESAEKAFNNSINKLCEKQNLSVIFKEDL